MDSTQILERLKKREKRARGHMHSPNHILADELAVKLGDPSHFGAYLKLATTKNHDQLRLILGKVLESTTAKSKPRLFMFLVKKEL